MKKNDQTKYTWYASKGHRDSEELEPQLNLARTKSYHTLHENRRQFSSPRLTRMFGSLLEVPHRDLPGTLEETDRDSVMPEQFRIPQNLAELLLSESNDKDELIPLYDRVPFSSLEDKEPPKEFNWDEEAARDSEISTRPPKEKYLRHSEESMREVSEIKLMIEWNTDENAGPKLSFGPRSPNDSKIDGSQGIKNENNIPGDKRSKVEDSVDKQKNYVDGVRYHQKSLVPNDIDRKTRDSSNWRREVGEPSETTPYHNRHHTSASPAHQLPPHQGLPSESSLNHDRSTKDSLRGDEGKARPSKLISEHKCSVSKVSVDRKENHSFEEKKQDSFIQQNESYSQLDSKISVPFIDEQTIFKPEQENGVSKLPYSGTDIRHTAKFDPDPFLKRTKTSRRSQDLYFDNKTPEASHKISGVFLPKSQTKSVDSTAKIYEGNKVLRPPGNGNLVPIPSLISNNFGSKSQGSPSVYRDLYEDKYLNTPGDSSYKPPKKYYTSYIKKKKTIDKTAKSKLVKYPTIPAKSHSKPQKRHKDLRSSHSPHSISSDSSKLSADQVGGARYPVTSEKKDWPGFGKGPNLRRDDQWQWPKAGKGNRKCQAFKNKK